MESIKQLLQSTNLDREVTVRGWVRTKRGNAYVNFVAVNDGSTVNSIQTVFELTQFSESDLKEITTGACISVVGKLVQSQGKGQSVELQATAVTVHGAADPESFPMQPKKHSLEFLREKAHLRVRTSTFSAVFRIRHALTFGIHRYFNDRGYFNVHAPIITGSDAEGAGEMFRVTTLPAINPPIKSKDAKGIDYSKFDEIALKYYQTITDFYNSGRSKRFAGEELNRVLRELSSSDESLKGVILMRPEAMNQFYRFIEDKREKNKGKATKYEALGKSLNLVVEYFRSGRLGGFDKRQLIQEVKAICQQNGWRCETAKRKYSVKDAPYLAASFYNLFQISHNSEVDFSQDFFGKETNLTVSGQLQAELAALALSKVYTFGPTFRAENSNTSRHLAEFWMIEPEMAFCDIHGNMDIAEDFLQQVIAYVKHKCADDIAFLAQRLEEEEKAKPAQDRSELGLIEKLDFVIANKFERITYTEAIAILRESQPNKKKKFNYLVDEWGIDLQSEHERYLVEKHFKKPVIITGYPAKVKAFYMRLNENCEEGKETVAAMDILFPGIGEIVGGSQREERYDVLVEKMKQFHIPEESMWWYLETRKFGTVTHSGFGLGFERLMMFITGMTNVRDVIPFPRTPKNCDF